MSAEKTTGMPMAQIAAYVAFFLAGLIESVLNWTNLFHAGSDTGALSFMKALLAIPPLAIAGSLGAARYKDPWLAVLAVGFAVVAAFQFVFFRFSLWATEPPPRGLFEFMSGFDMAWGVLCVIAGPLKQIGVSWRLGVVLFLGLAAVCIGAYVAGDRTWAPIWSDRAVPGRDHRRPIELGPVVAMLAAGVAPVAVLVQAGERPSSSMCERSAGGSMGESRRGS
jgi:hypothetical protein